MSNAAHVWIDRREVIYERDDLSFDRVAFAMHALRLVKPPGMTVAVVETRRGVHTQRGRDLRGGRDASWGLLGVPPHASRADIAVAVASLAGKSGDPFVLDLIIGHAIS